MKCLLPILGLLLALVPAQAQDQDRPATTRAGTASVEFLDVGQGDAILIRSPEGKAALIDAGPSKDIVPLLRGRGVTSIDMVVVTHHHQDHYGGMEAVIREFRPRLFLATGSSHTTPHYLRLLKLVRDGGIQAVFPTDTTRRIDLGSVTLTVFPQPPENRSDENDNSIGLRVQYGSFSVLLTGDSEAGERVFWENNVPNLVRDCTVLKLAHHGTSNGTDARWLALVRPKLAVASLGLGNEFGHPHPETLAVLARMNIPLLRTDLEGTVSVVSDGKDWGESVSGKSPRGPPVRDERVVVAGHKPKSSKGSKVVKSPSAVVDINTATLEELEAIPGIGPTFARRIIEGRPYGAVGDLRRVKGIGPKRFEEILPFVTAR